MQTTSSNNLTGVSWGAILAGAACAAALSFILLILGFGLSLSSISPWSGSSAIAVIGVSSIVWVAFTQLAASGLGGYVAGRLRVRWLDVHDHEVYFRDTAHGLITWAVATLFAVVLLGSAVSSILDSVAETGAEAAGTTLSTSGTLTETESGNAAQRPDYFIDALLRAAPGADNSQRADNAVRSELSTILFRNISNGDVDAEDYRYAAQIVSNHTELTQQQAQERVARIVTEARVTATAARQAALDAAKDARKVAAYSALWMVVALLGGAFFSSFMATVGGRQRDSMDQ